jgi:hypothetical protein
MKNPWMSMWLSAANSATGAARGQWAAEMQRQQNAFVKEWVRVSTAGLTGASPAPKKRTKKRGG